MSDNIFIEFERNSKLMTKIIDFKLTESFTDMTPELKLYSAKLELFVQFLLRHDMALAVCKEGHRLILLKPFNQKAS